MTADEFRSKMIDATEKEVEKIIKSYEQYKDTGETLSDYLDMEWEVYSEMMEQAPVD